MSELDPKTNLPKTKDTLLIDQSNPKVSNAQLKQAFNELQIEGLTQKPRQIQGTFDTYEGINVASDRDFNEIRARAQSTPELIGKSLMQGASTLVGAGLEAVGFLGDVPSYVGNLISGTQQEFERNFISQAGKNLQDATLDAFPIYQTNQAQDGGLGRFADGTFWASHAPSLAITLSLMIPAGGVAMGMTRLAKMARLGRAGQQTTATVSAALASRHAENVMEGFGTYEQVFESAITEGLSEQNAKMKAGHAASALYKTGYLNLWQDVVQWGTLLRGFKFTDAAVKGSIINSAKGTKDPVLSKIRETLISNPTATVKQAVKKGGYDWKDWVLQGGLEGFEEFNQSFMADHAIRNTDILLGTAEGEVKGFFESYLSGDFIDQLKDTESQNAMVMGVIGGLLFQGAGQLASNRSGRNALANEAQQGKKLEAQANRLKGRLKRIERFTQAGNDVLAQEEFDFMLSDLVTSGFIGPDGNIVGSAREGTLTNNIEMFEAVQQMTDAEITELGLGDPQGARDNAKRALSEIKIIEEIYNKNMNKSRGTLVDDIINLYVSEQEYINTIHERTTGKLRDKINSIKTDNKDIEQLFQSLNSGQQEYLVNYRELNQLRELKKQLESLNTKELYKNMPRLKVLERVRKTSLGKLDSRIKELEEQVSNAKGAEGLLKKDIKQAETVSNNVDKQTELQEFETALREREYMLDEGNAMLLEMAQPRSHKDIEQAIQLTKEEALQSVKEFAANIQFGEFSYVERKDKDGNSQLLELHKNNDGTYTGYPLDQELKKIEGAKPSQFKDLDNLLDTLNKLDISEVITKDQAKQRWRSVEQLIKDKDYKGAAQSFRDLLGSTNYQVYASEMGERIRSNMNEYVQGENDVKKLEDFLEYIKDINNPGQTLWISDIINKKIAELEKMYEDQINAIESSITKKSEKLDSIRNNLNEIESEINSIRDTVEQHRNEVRELAQKKNKTQKEILKTHRAVRKRLNDAKKKADLQISNLSSTRTKLKKQQDQLDKDITLYTQLRNKVQSSSTLPGVVVRESLNRIKNKIDAIRTETLIDFNLTDYGLNKLKDHYQELIDAIQPLENSIKGYRDMIENLYKANEELISTTNEVFNEMIADGLIENEDSPLTPSLYDEYKRRYNRAITDVISDKYYGADYKQIRDLINNARLTNNDPYNKWIKSIEDSFGQNELKKADLREELNNHITTLEKYKDAINVYEKVLSQFRHLYTINKGNKKKVNIKDQDDTFTPPQREIEDVFSRSSGNSGSTLSEFADIPASQRRFFQFVNKTDINSGGYLYEIKKATDFDADILNKLPEKYKKSDVLVGVLTNSNGEYVLADGSTTTEFNSDTSLYTTIPMDDYFSSNMSKTYHLADDGTFKTTDEQLKAEYPTLSKEAREIKFKERMEELKQDHAEFRKRVFSDLAQGKKVVRKVFGKSNGVENLIPEIDRSGNPRKISSVFDVDNITFEVITKNEVTKNGSTYRTTNGAVILKDESTGNWHRVHNRGLSKQEIDTIKHAFVYLVANAKIKNGKVDTEIPFVDSKGEELLRKDENNVERKVYAKHIIQQFIYAFADGKSSIEFVNEGKNKTPGGVVVIRFKEGDGQVEVQYPLMKFENGNPVNKLNPDLAKALSDKLENTIHNVESNVTSDQKHEIFYYEDGFLQKKEYASYKNYILENNVVGTWLDSSQTVDIIDTNGDITTTPAITHFNQNLDYDNTFEGKKVVSRTTPVKKQEIKSNEISFKDMKPDTDYYLVSSEDIGTVFKVKRGIGKVGSSNIPYVEIEHLTYGQISDNQTENAEEISEALKSFITDESFMSTFNIFTNENSAKEFIQPTETKISSVVKESDVDSALNEADSIENIISESPTKEDVNEIDTFKEDDDLLLQRNSDYKELSPKQSKRVINNLSKRTDIPFHTMSEERAVGFINFIQEQLGNDERFTIETLPKGMYWNGVAYAFSKDNITMDTPFHEISHPIVNQIISDNSVLFESLRNEVQNSPEGKSIIERVIKNYPNAVIDGQLTTRAWAEILTTALGEDAANKYYGKANQGLRGAISRLWEHIKQFFRNLTNETVEIASLDANTTIGDIGTLLGLSQQRITLTPSVIQQFQRKEIDFNPTNVEKSKRKEHSNFVKSTFGEITNVETIDVANTILKPEIKGGKFKNLEILPSEDIIGYKVSFDSGTILTVIPKAGHIEGASKLFSKDDGSDIKAFVGLLYLLETNEEVVHTKTDSEVFKPQITTTFNGKSSAYTKDAMDTMNFYFFGYLTNKYPSRLMSLFDGSTETKQFYDTILTDVFNQLNKNKKKLADDIRADKTHKLVNQKLEILNNYTFLLKNYNRAVELFSEHLNQYNIETIKDDSDIVNSKETKDKNQLWTTESLKFSSKMNATSSIRLLIGSMGTTNKNISFSTYTNVNFGDMFNILANSLAGTQNLAQMKSRLETYKNSVDGIQSLFNRLFKKLDNIEGLSPSEVQVLLEFRQTFAKNYNNYVIAYTSAVDFFSLKDANVNTQKSRLIAKWNSNITPNSKNFKEENNEVVYDLKKMKETDVLSSESLSKNSKYNPTQAQIDSVQDYNNAYESYFQAVNFLKELGIEITSTALPKGDEFIKRAGFIYESLRDKSPDQNKYNVLSNSSNHKENVFKHIVQHEIDSSIQAIENQHYNTENETVYNVNLYNYITGQVAKFNNAGTIEELLTEMPHLRSVYSSDSLLLNINNFTDKQHGFLFNKSGERTNTSFNVTFADGLINETSTTGIPYDKLEYSDKIRFLFNSLMENQHALFRPGDNSIERFINMPDFYEILGNGYLSQIKQYIITEFETVFSLQGSGFVNTTKLNDIDYVIEKSPLIGILGKTANGRSIIQKVMESSSTESLNNAKTLSAVESMISNFINNEANNIVDFLVQNDILQRKGDEFINNGIKSLTRSKTEKLNQTQVKNIAKKFAINSMIGKIEQTKIFTGPLLFHKNPDDFFKRMSSSVGTYKTMATGHIENQMLNIYFSRKKDDPKRLYRNVNGEISQDYSEGSKPILRSVTYSDPSVVSRFLNNMKGSIREQYKGLNESDAIGFISLEAYRDMKLRSGEWTEAQEKLYNWEKATDKRNVEHIDWETGQIIKITHNDLYKSNGKRVTFNMYKPIYNGPLAEDGFIPGLYKTALIPILPSYKEYGSLNEMKDFMKNNHVDLITFESANKIGTKLDSNNNLPEAYTIDSDGDAVINLENIPFQHTYFEYWGSQLDTGTDRKYKAPSGSQANALLLSNIYEYGQPNERLKNLAEELTSVKDEMIAKDVDSIKSDLGLVQNEDGDYIFDEDGISKLSKFIYSEASKRDVNNNVKDSIKLLEQLVNDMGSDIGLDILSNRDKVENILASIADSRVIRKKMNGGIAAQAPATFFEKGVRKYSNKHKQLLSSELDFYADGTMEVYLPHYFKELFRDDNIDIKDLELLEGIAFRIPTSGLNSIERIKIKGFLPQSAGDTIIVPSEIVAKAGSDYDIDKLNLWLPNYIINNQGLPEYIRYSSPNKNETKQEFLERIYDKQYGDKRKIIGNVLKNFDNIGDWLAKANEKSPELISIIADTIDYTENIETVEKLTEFIQNKGKDLLELSMPVSRSVFIKTNESKSVEQINSRKALENRYIEIAKEIVSHADNRDQLLTPIGNNLLKAQQERIAPTQNRTMTDIIGNFEYNSQVTQRNITSKQLTGIAALHVKDHTYATIYDYKLLKENFKLGFDSNATDKHIRLGGKTNVDGQMISEVLNQLVNTAVDGAKDPIFFDLNINFETASVLFYMVRAGVSLNDVFDFLTSPQIKRYTELRQRIDSEYTENSTYDDKAITEKVINEFGKDAKEYIDRYKIIKEGASMLDQVIQGTRIDTQAMGKNTSELDIILDSVKDVANNNNLIINSGLIYQSEGYLHNRYKALIDFKNMFKPLFTTQSNNKFLKAYQNILDTIKNKRITLDEKVKILDKAKAHYIAQALLNNSSMIDGHPTKSISSNKGLIIGNNTVAKKLKNFQAKNTENSLVNKLTPIIGKEKYPFDGEFQYIDTIKMFDQRMDTIEQNALIDSWRELHTINAELSRELIQLSILQSGLELNPMSFHKYIPAEFFTEMVHYAIQAQNESNSHTAFNDIIFERNFLISQYRDNTLVPVSKSYTDYRGRRVLKIPDNPIYKKFVLKKEYQKDKKATERAKELNIPIFEKIPRIYVDLKKDAESIRPLFSHIKNRNKIEIRPMTIRDFTNNVSVTYYGESLQWNELIDRDNVELSERKISKEQAYDNNNKCKIKGN